MSDELFDAMRTVMRKAAEIAGPASASYGWRQDMEEAESHLEYVAKEYRRARKEADEAMNRLVNTAEWVASAEAKFQEVKAREPK